MWTHLQPYLPNDHRASTIKRKARIGLWRAINLRRLVVLAGSGATAGLGQMSWNSILISFVSLSVRQFCQALAYPENDGGTKIRRGFRRAPVHQLRLFAQIMELCGLSDMRFQTLSAKDDPGGVIQSHLKGREASGDLDRNALRIAVDLCEELLRAMDRDQPVPLHYSQVRKEFATFFRSTDQAVKDSSILNHLDVHPIEAILDFTQSRRILTTNYDAEFEAYLFERWLSSEKETHAHHQFRGLSAFDAAQDPVNPLNIAVPSPLRRGISSVSIDLENVGDLVNFASFSRAQQYQVFHLHGRLDRPKEMVVTKRDYRRVYAQDPSSAEAFRAAQEILFAGNDVLMVGFAGEDEVLLPFRRFVQRGRAAGQIPRRTFALLPSDTSTEYLRKNASKAIDWALDYDIYTIHYGGLRYRAVMQALETIRGRLSKATPGTPPETPIFDEDALKAIGTHRIRLTPKDSRGPCALMTAQRLQSLLDLALQEQNALAGDGADDWLTQARRKRDQAEAETRTNAMIYELRELGRLSRDWWDTWRHTPHERRARYHVAAPQIGGAPGYLSVRHCSIWKPSLLNNSPDSWTPLAAARDLADKNGRNAQDTGRRILRFTAPRGTGQATFANLLHHRNNQAYLFDRNNNDYCGAFLAHLSFSMEFNSVLKALSRFFCFWAARCLEARDPRENHIDRIEPRRTELVALYEAHVQGISALLQRPNMDLFVLERLRRLAGTLRIDQALKARILTHFRDPLAVANLRLSSSELKTVSEAFVASAWEDNQDMMDLRPGLPLETILGLGMPESEDGQTVQRRHRLDMLRKAMADYTAVSNGARVFVCLSGLDRITNACGDAYNPAHRAFFRLLTDSEEREETDPFLKQASARLPMDLVLIAGDPNSPIAYLSEEFAPKGAATALASGPQDQAPRLGDLKTYSQRSGTGRTLKRWAELPRMPWSQRVKMLNVTPSSEDGAEAARIEADYQANPRSEDRERAPRSCELEAAIFLRWAQSTRSDQSHRAINDLHGSSTIHRLLWENLSLSLWVLRLWIYQERESQDGLVRSVPLGFHSFLRDLDAIAARDGFNGVLQYVLECYERVDRAQHKQHGGGGQASFTPELHALILRHLVLFALPVEPWVLLGCPLIKDVLRKEFQARQRRFGPLPEPLETDQDNPIFRDAWLVRLEWLERAFMLNEVNRALQVLVRRALVIKVQPASDNMSDPGEQSPEHCLHVRYSLHNRIRQHLAHTIQLGVHDGADINHHRMSIYCDQPKELPSPSHEHFRLVRDILEYQIDHCRDTLYAMFHLGHERNRVKDIMEGWDNETGQSGEPDKDPGAGSHDSSTQTDADRIEEERAHYAAARRIFAPIRATEPDLAPLEASLDARAKHLGLEEWRAPDGFAGSFGRLHAVPQRLRAMLSLLQGSFAIGSLSRMTGLTQELNEEEPTPFDAYRGWLRSLLNAGTSLDRTQNEFSRLFHGAIFQPLALDGDTTSLWLDRRGNGDDSPEQIAKNRMRQAELPIRIAARDLRLGAVQQTDHKTLRHPFYRDEIAWLYNERGLAALTQGLIYDALPLLRQATFMMSHRRVPDSDSHAFHAAERRIQLNFAMALLERGRIGEAQRVLQVLFDESLQVPRSTPSEIRPFSELYLAICDHVSGSFHKAEAKYANLLVQFSEKRQFRAVSILTQSHADLCRAKGNLTKGIELAEMAIKAASRSEQRDVEHLAMVSLARLLIADDKRSEAMGLLNRALDYAGQIGLIRVEVDAKTAMSILMTRQGDFSLAGQFASEAAARCVRSGLRLRKLSALLSYATSRRARGSVDFGNRLLAKIAAEAEDLGYMTVASMANSALSQN